MYYTNIGFFFKYYISKWFFCELHQPKHCQSRTKWWLYVSVIIKIFLVKSSRLVFSEPYVATGNLMYLSNNVIFQAKVSMFITIRKFCWWVIEKFSNEQDMEMQESKWELCYGPTTSYISYTAHSACFLGEFRFWGAAFPLMNGEIRGK
jgi:hypothetical protein